MSYHRFSRYTNFAGFENEHLRVLHHLRYDTKMRTHRWLLLCKHCGVEYETVAATVTRRKSCGCRAKIGRFKKKDNFDAGQLLKVKW